MAENRTPGAPPRIESFRSCTKIRGSPLVESNLTESKSCNQCHVVHKCFVWWPRFDQTPGYSNSLPVAHHQMQAIALPVVPTPTAMAMVKILVRLLFSRRSKTCSGCHASMEDSPLEWASMGGSHLLTLSLATTVPPVTKKQLATMPVQLPIGFT